MRTVTAIFLSILFSMSVWSQDICSYTVQRGETLESIAKTFGVSTEELRSSNLDLENFYTGLVINIPIKRTISAKAQSLDEADDFDKNQSFLEKYVAYNDECEKADDIFEKGDYKKAQKLYQQIIKKYESYFCCAEALYGNALCSYNRGKWKDAIRDLSAVADNPDCSKSERDHCKEILAKAKAKRQKQLENRENLWGGILLSAAAIGTAVAVSATSKSSNSSGYSSFNYPSANTSSRTYQGYENLSDDAVIAQVNTKVQQDMEKWNREINAMPATSQNIMQQAIARTKFEWDMEEQNFKENFKRNYMLSHNGKEPSQTEVSQAYSNYIQTKANANQTVQQASSGLYDKELGISSSSFSSKTSSRSSYQASSSQTSGIKCKKTHSQDYAHCGGSGICSRCNGKGKYFDNSFGIARTVDPCTTCGGTGVCPSCHGH